MSKLIAGSFVKLWKNEWQDIVKGPDLSQAKEEIVIRLWVTWVNSLKQEALWHNYLIIVHCKVMAATTVGTLLEIVFSLRYVPNLYKGSSHSELVWRQKRHISKDTSQIAKKLTKPVQTFTAIKLPPVGVLTHSFFTPVRCSKKIR
jgi:hypothetical protein